MTDARGQSLNTLEKALGGIPGLHDFARPLLTQALTSAGYSVPIDQVSVRLYTPSLDAFGVATGGFSARTLSWLQAALHNFEEPETQERYFAAGSGFITSPDAQVALHNGDIDSASHALIQRVLNGERGIKLADGRQLWYRTPCVMGLELKGCVIFSLSYEDRRTEKLMAWIPGDPHHPLKQYASYASLRDECVRKRAKGSHPGHVARLCP